MRFICLHGMGANSQVFEVQTAAIRHELGGQHTYDFVEGTVPSPMAPGLSPLFNPEDSYYAYFDPSSTESGQNAFNMLRDYLRDQGPFDGVIGFSQGACLAAAYIAAGEKLGLSRQIHPSFKCAVFISSMPVPDAAAFNLRGEIRLLDPDIDGELIRIPTVHIWGIKDVYSKHCSTVREICDQRTVSSFIHGGGHEVPGSGAQEAVIEIVKALRKCFSKLSEDM